jgi:pentatricopeptide repeat protein
MIIRYWKCIRSIRGNEIKPNTVSFNSLIDIYVKLDDINQAEQIYEKMKSNSTARIGNTETVSL